MDSLPAGMRMWTRRKAVDSDIVMLALIAGIALVSWAFIEGVDRI